MLPPFFFFARHLIALSPPTWLDASSRLSPPHYGAQRARARSQHTPERLFDLYVPRSSTRRVQGRGGPASSKKPRRHAYAREATEPRARWCSETTRTTSLGKGRMMLPSDRELTLDSLSQLVTSAARKFRSIPPATLDWPRRATPAEFAAPDESTGGRISTRCNLRGRVGSPGPSPIPFARSGRGTGC